MSIIRDLFISRTPALFKKLTASLVAVAGLDASTMTGDHWLELARITAYLIAFVYFLSQTSEKERARLLEDYRGELLDYMKSDKNIGSKFEVLGVSGRDIEAIRNRQAPDSLIQRVGERLRDLRG